AAFGVPMVAALVAGRAAFLRFLHSVGGKITGMGVAVLFIALLAYASYDSQPVVIIATPPPDHHPAVYLVNNARGVLPGRFGGVDDLVTLMGRSGLKLHRSPLVGLTAGPDGLIDRDDVVIVKINAQWAQRGGTNTDVLRGILRRIVEHPDGFVGEIIVADNGQGYGSLDRAENNAEDHGQSPQDVVNDFAAEGWSVSTRLWDAFRTVSVGEYANSDVADGYVLSAALDPETAIRVSYPKFQSPRGACISYKYGIWDPVSTTYDHDRLVVLNIPVLKTHSIYAVTGAVKNHMGVITQSLGTESHNGVGRGGLGSVLAEVRVPDLTILDCIWVLARPGWGPSASYTQASRRDQLVAGTDPVALDVWAVKNILVPQILANGYTVADYASTQDPDDPDSTFRRYLDRSMNEMLAAGIPTTNDYNAVRLFVYEDGSSIPTVSDWGAALFALLLLVVGGATVARLPRPIN
ncbi:MAG: DUF362 domain-containing protein, partial [Phycisphaerales bacterium]|nr:DUF362 domain-containing protein [Phycisphaerales bacterium]